MQKHGLNKLTPVAISQVRLRDKFWQRRLDINRTVTLETAYNHLKRNGAIKAYQWNWWDLKKGEPPWRIWVGDVAKWVEACAYVLATHPNERLRKRVDRVVTEIVRGQKDDGYLYANAIPKKWRWANLGGWHEMYDLGHLVEAGVALRQSTGDRTLLDAVCRAADLVERNFGWAKGKKRGYDGHPEIELALVRLYRETKEPRYLKLARFFVEARGTRPHYYEQEQRAAAKLGLKYPPWTKAALQTLQAHKPVRQQTDAVGHAVRAMYLYCAVADVAVETADRELLAVAKRLWKSTTRCRMYIHGGIGSNPHGEAFTHDYDLPNELAYAETCASIALIFFAHRLLQAEVDGEYADAIERALYNLIPAAVSADGRDFFYSNRLTVYPRVLQEERDQRSPVRREWFGCSCCPPNLARLLASLGRYIYSTAHDAIYVHLYVGSSVECQVGQTSLRLIQETEYPWKDRLRLTVQPASEAEFGLALRIPSWARTFTVTVNGKRLKIVPKKGYILIRRTWRKNDRVELVLPMPIERIEAHPSVRQACGRVAIQRGPVVYCLEEADNGKELADLTLPWPNKLAVTYDPRLGAVPVITGRAFRRKAKGRNETLYRPAASQWQPVRFKAIPYCMWNNRGEGEMRVWIQSVIP